jgi:hypothetical protein
MDARTVHPASLAALQPDTVGMLFAVFSFSDDDILLL